MTGIYIAAAWVAVFIAEMLAGRHKGIYRRQDVLVTLTCQALSIGATRPLASLLVAWVMMFLLPQYKGVLEDQPFWPSFLFLMVVTDVAFYWGHRWAHTMRNSGLNWLWLLHRTHHAGKYMNVAVTLHIPQGRPEFYGLPGPNPPWLEATIYPLYRAAPARVS